MRYRTDLPRPIREIETVWITMSDGCRLAARVWLPVDAEQNPVPAILEYIPYRRNDGTARRDSTRHPYVAGHGYACVRLDMRGSGDSDGLLMDEYLPREQQDAVEAIAWIAAQPWCTGAVGMIGISWGGFNGLQVAAHRPPALKAVITLCSTDDRYADDVHYLGGCLLGEDTMAWGSIMFAYNARPPDPAVVGERWREMWLQRLENTPPFIEEWTRHQRRDAFWKQGSVCEDYGAITCPVYAVGGWADAYTNAIPRLLAGLSGPRKGLIGPWSHNYPEQGVPGPAIGFLQECLRWWDHWLKGIETGIMDEPMLRAWMLEAVEPRPFYAEWPGRWVAEPSWPSPRIGFHTYALNAGTLDDAPAAETVQQIKGSQACGLLSGTWCPYGRPVDLPPDQRPEDGRSLTFTSAPLDERMEILGFPEVTLHLTSDKPLALVAVRLCDIAPDGSSMLVTRGILNLTHRDSHEHPTPLEPGRRYTVTVRLNAIAYALPPGHRWRVSISPTYWPWAWPSPEAVTLGIVTGASRLTLPVRAPRPEDAQLAPFGPAEGTPPLAAEALRADVDDLDIRFDTASGRHLRSRTSDGGFRLLDSGRAYGHWSRDTFSIVEGEPLSAEARSEHSIVVARGEWRTRVQTSSTLSADATTFYLTNVLEAYEGNVRIFARTWTAGVPRDHA